MAPVANAPVEVVRQLARNSEISVAGPVLTHSKRLTEDDLVDIAKSNGQDHLLAISKPGFADRTGNFCAGGPGDQRVAHAVAKNSGARFSKAGFVTLVKRAEADAELAEHLVLRCDIPPHVFDKFLSSATDIVRARLLASASPENQDQILRALAAIGDEINLPTHQPRNYTVAESMAQELNREGKLNEPVLVGRAQENRYKDIIASLAALCGASAQTMIASWQMLVLRDSLLLVRPPN